MNLSQFFATVKDERVVNRCSHLLSDILALVLIAVIGDCDNFSEIADYGEDNIESLRNDFGLSFPCGIPSEDTLGRVFKRLNNKELNNTYQSFLGSISLAGKHLCIDGKELRSTIPTGKKQATVQMVNMLVQESGLSFACEQVAQKSNEITAIPSLLKSVDCQGAVVSIDAIGCQKAITSQIREQGADYVIALKANQKTLYEQAEQEFALEKGQLLSCETQDKGHGRVEIRKAYVSHDLKWIENAADWHDLKSLIMVERIRTEGGEESRSKGLYMSSIENISPEKALAYVRNHWAIENGLHWQLDFTFKEDASVLSEEKAIANLHVIRKWAMALLKKLPTKISGRRKRKRLGRDLKQLAELFNT